MSESTSGSLIKKFKQMAQPDYYSVNLKFKAKDETIFEIELSSNGMRMPEMQQQLLDVIGHSVATATKTIISAK